MNREADTFARLILFRPRPEFPLPAEWAGRPWIPLGKLRPLLQAISPVRDLSDHWRWVALPLPLSVVQAVLAGLPGVVTAPTEFHRRDAESAERGREEGTAVVRALLVPAAAGEVERVELSPAGDGLLGVTSPTAMAAMQTVAAALRRDCGCVAVGL